MLPLLIALQFLTSLPIRLPAMPTPRQQGRSLLHYPAVGLFLGALLWLAALLLEGASPLLQAALLLALWVALTGALHLDGLADSADAWLGGFGDPARTLEIMKDPRSGPIAVVVLVLLLLLNHPMMPVTILAAVPLAMPKIEPILASATDFTTPSSTQRTVSMAWMNRMRSRTSSCEICASAFSKRAFSSGHRCFLPPAG